MNSEFQATTSSIWAEYSLLIMPAEIFTEMDLKFMTTNRFNFQIITSKFIGIFGSGGGGEVCLTWLDYNFHVDSSQISIRGHLATMVLWQTTVVKHLVKHPDNSLKGLYTTMDFFRDFFRSSQHNFITISGIKKHKG